MKYFGESAQFEYKEESIKADRLMRRGLYKQAIDLYESSFSANSDNCYLHTRIGLCRIMLREMERAADSLARALGYNHYNCEALLASAYLDLWNSRTHIALGKYARILKLDPDNYFIKNLLQKLKKTEKIEQLVLEKSPLYFISNPSFFYRLSFFFHILGPFRPALAVSLIIISLLTFGLYYFKNPGIADIFKKKQSADLQIVSGNAPLPDTETLRSMEEIMLFDEPKAGPKSSELVRYFNNMKTCIKKRRINEAIIIFNRVIQSDANILIKEKFNLLSRYIPEPNFEDFTFEQRIDEITKNDENKNIFIKYAGVASQVEHSSVKTKFSFTIEENGNYTATADVIFTPALAQPPENKKKYFILGRYIGFQIKAKKIIIKGLAIRPF